MADEEETEAEDGEAEGPKGRFAGKKKLIIIAAAALVLLLGGGGAAFFLMGGDGGGEETEAAAEGEGGEEVAGGGEGATDARAAADATLVGLNRPGYMGLPNLLVNLSSDSARQVYLRIEATLELSSASEVRDARERIDVIVDGFQTFLREMRPRDIAGSGGLLRLKEELLVRANDAIGRDIVRNVYLTEFLIQ